MKASLITLTIAGILSAAVIVSCTSATKKTELKVKDPIVCNQVSPAITRGCLEEIKNYKKEVENIIAINNRNVAEYGKMIIAARIIYNKNDGKKIAELEKRNADLKKLVANYRADGLENCELFEAEFRYEMNELESAFKNQTQTNSLALTLN